ncbi:MAG: substrate-binding domain-containing protein [Planctomycetota bacterium]
MARHPVYQRVKEALRQRILAGEYVVRDIPGERRLATETGVSYMTARKAVGELIDEQVLARRPNGTLAVHPAFSESHASATAALLIPAFPSPHLARCRIEIERLAREHRVRMRTVEYAFWYDSIIPEALEGADGLLIIPSTEDVPDHLIKAFAAPPNRVAFFDADMTSRGLTSVHLFDPSHFRLLFDHLRDGGFESISCLNTQGHNDEILSRIACWKQWGEETGTGGTLYDHEVEPYGDPLVHAHGAVLAMLDRGDTLPEAMVCTTYPAAVGAVRALHDRGIIVGRDIAVAAFNIEHPARYATPSITGLEFPDLAPLLGGVFEWFTSEQNGPRAGRLIVPDEPSLFVGESTMQASSSASRSS